MLPVGCDLRVDGDEVHPVVEKLVTRQRSPGLVVQHWYHFLSSRLPVRAGASTSPESHQPALRIPATHATSHALYRLTGGPAACDTIARHCHCRQRDYCTTWLNASTANAEAWLPHSKPMRHGRLRLEPVSPPVSDLTAGTAGSLVPYILAQV